MRTSAALGKIQVNFSFALVGTNFATTEALALPRSAERKVRPRKGEGVRKNKTSDSSGINATSSKPKEGVEEKRKLSLLDKRDEEQSDGGSWKRQ